MKFKIQSKLILFFIICFCANSYAGLRGDGEAYKVLKPGNVNLFEEPHIYSKKDNLQETVKNSYFYIGHDQCLNGLSQHTEIGYRFQKDFFGISVNTGINALFDKYFYFPLALDLCLFPKPNQSSQTYLGVGLQWSFLYIEEEKIYHKTHYKYLYDYKTGEYDIYSWTDEYSDWFWKKYFLLKPYVFLGRDFCLQNNNKIFAQIYFVPGFLNLSYKNPWEGATTFGFKLGYGF